MILSPIESIGGFDAFEGTNLADAGKKMDFYLHVVRGFFTEEDASAKMTALLQTIDSIATQKGTARSVEAKGTKLWYQTFQAVSGECTCKYIYSSVASSVLSSL